MRYKAIFFDRDGTLTYFCPEKEQWRNQIISQWSGIPFELPYDKMMNIFNLASEGKKPWYKTVDDEKEFFKRFYRYLLIGECIEEDLESRAQFLFDELWCNGDRALFPETLEVLDYFYKNGYKIGVISDTSPSLEYTLQQLGIAKYFTSFTASSLVGAGKPSPIIFNAALAAQGVSAQESIYVDDYKVEAVGAREQGFTSFLIDRSGNNADKWSIQSLKQLIDFVENFKMNALVINCSPVRNGATAEIVHIVCECLKNRFDVKSICIDDFEIGFCKGCRNCHNTAKCIQHDDVDLIMENYEWADVIVSVSPSYWADVPGQFKVFIDRCTPWCNTHEPHAKLSPGKKGYTIALRTGPSMPECERVIRSIEHFHGHLEIESCGKLGLCAVEYKEDIAGRIDEITDFCNRILEM